MMNFVRKLLLISLVALVFGCDDEDKKPRQQTEADMGEMMMDMGMTDVQLGELNILNGEVRSCDIILSSDDLSLRGKVEFSDQVRGALTERLPVTAISIVARQDRSIAGEIISFSVTADQRSRISLSESRCFDSNGNPVDGDVVSLNLGE